MNRAGTITITGCAGLLGLSLVLAGPAVSYDRLGTRAADPRISARLLAVGSVLGLAQGQEAVLADPTALGLLTQSEMAVSGGWFAGQGLAATWAFAHPLPGLGKVGLAVSGVLPFAAETLAPACDLDSREQALSGVYCGSIWTGLEAAVRFRAVRLERPGLPPAAGESMGVGVRWHDRDAFWLSLNGDNLFQPAIDSGPEAAAYPRLLRASAGVRWDGVVRMGLEYSREFSIPENQRVAVGWESDFSQQWFIRAGADLQSVSAGVGLNVRGWLVDYGWSLDYQQNRMQHRLGVGCRFGAYQAFLESSGQFLTKGGLQPRINFKIHARSGILLKQWAFRIADASGTVVYSVIGKHALQPTLTWEGRNQRSKSVEDGVYVGYLEGEDYEGNRLQSNRVRIQVISRQAPEFRQLK